MSRELMERRIYDDDFTHRPLWDPELVPVGISKYRVAVSQKEITRTCSLDPSFLYGIADVASESLKIAPLRRNTQRRSLSIDHEGGVLEKHEPIQLISFIGEIDVGAGAGQDLAEVPYGEPV